MSGGRMYATLWSRMNRFSYRMLKWTIKEQMLAILDLYSVRIGSSNFESRKDITVALYGFYVAESYLMLLSNSGLGFRIEVIDVQTCCFWCTCYWWVFIRERTGYFADEDVCWRSLGVFWCREVIVRFKMFLNTGFWQNHFLVSHRPGLHPMRLFFQPSIEDIVEKRYAMMHWNLTKKLSAI